MGTKLNLSQVPETAIPAGRWQPLNERLGITHFGISAVVMDPLEPGTRIVCLGAGTGAEHPYGRWITEAAAG